MKIWDDYIDPVLFSIRTSLQESTKYTPFYLMHGREPRLPFEAENSIAISNPSQLPDTQQAIDQLCKVKDTVFPTVTKNIEVSQEKQKKQYAKRN